MEIIKNDTSVDYRELQNQFNNINFLDTVFFDIETTGFAAKNSRLYMIGVLYVCPETKNFNTIQWFLDEYNDENKLLTAFINFIKDYKVLMHFNGKGFDIPYLEAKAEAFNVACNFDNFKHIDLYKIASKLKHFFKTENIKLKTLEQFFGLRRDDEFTGKELISVYDEYMKTKDNRLKHFLTLHNFEDLKGMLTVMNILAYNNMFDGHYTYKNIDIDDVNNELTIHLQLNAPLAQRISYNTCNIHMTAFDNKLKIMIKLYKGTLKFFYADYKDYYYLPQEDVAIHKSLASFVDKEFRQKAKASNCYTKKEGLFLPQYEITISPCFFENYKDKLSYFEANNEFYENETLILNYATHILNYLKSLR